MKIEREDIISNEAIKNVSRLSYEIDNLDGKLGRLAKKYNIPQAKVWAVLNTVVKKGATDFDLLAEEIDSNKWDKELAKIHPTRVIPPTR